MESVELNPNSEQVHQEKQYVESPELEGYIQASIEKHGVDLGPASVGCCLVYPNISKTRAGKVVKATGLVNHFSGHHYIILISGELWDILDEETRQTYVYYQLLHCDPVYKPKQGEWVMNIRKPDYQDYYTITDKVGNEWYKTIQASASSLYDLDPKQEQKVTA